MEDRDALLQNPRSPAVNTSPGARVLVNRALYHSHDSLAEADSPNPSLSPSWGEHLDPSVPAPKGTIKSSIFTLLSTIVGGGVLSLPFTFASCGIGLGLFLCISMAAISASSLRFSLFSRSEGKDFTKTEINSIK